MVALHGLFHFIYEFSTCYGSTHSSQLHLTSKGSRLLSDIRSIVVLINWIHNFFTSTYHSWSPSRCYILSDPLLYLFERPPNYKPENESYVDDSKLLLSFPVKDIDSAKTTIEQDLHRVAKWCSLNDLLINPTKTKLLLVGTRQMTNSLLTDFKLDFLGKQITPSSSGKDLGVVIDSHLT